MATPFELCWTDNFLEALTRDSFLPAVQSQFSHQQLLNVAREEVVSRIASALINAKDDFLVERKDITLVADDGRYDLPEYAMFDKIRRARCVGTGGRYKKLLRASGIDLDDVETTTSGTPAWVLFEGNELVLMPPPSSSFISSYPTLRVWLYRRPGKFVRAVTSGDNAGRCAQISTVVGTTVTYTGNTPSDFTASSVHDVYRGTYPFRRVATAITAASEPGPTSQTFSSSDAALLQAGDWVCMKNETCFLPIPDEIVPHAKSMTIRALSGTQGDYGKYDREMQDAARAAVQEFQTVGNRMDGQARLLSLKHSPFVGGKSRRSSFTGEDW